MAQQQLTTALPQSPQTADPTQYQANSNDQEAEGAGINPVSDKYGNREVRTLPPMTPEEIDWTDRFLAKLEARGFFDETKSRDIRAIFE
ncbi:hypothetical protein GCM10018954_005680 [Kutzneria kofuensis]